MDRDSASEARSDETFGRSIRADDPAREAFVDGRGRRRSTAIITQR